MAAPLPENEALRVQELKAHAILDTLPEQEYDDVVALASHLLDAPIALISLVDDERQWFKAKVGLDASETPRELAFCAHAILDPEHIFEISDARSDARFSDNSLVTGVLGIRFYAGAPILGEDGSPLGTVCVIDHAPRTLSAHQAVLLQRLARQTSALLRARRVALRAGAQATRLEQISQDNERERKHSQELLELALRSGNFGLWDLQLPSGSWTINDRECELLGFAPGSVRPDQVSWHALVHRDDLGALDRALRAHLAGDTPFYECEHRMRHHLGHWIWVHTRAIVVERDLNRPRRIVGTHQDVTNEREAKSAFLKASEFLRRTNVLAKVGGWELELSTKDLTWSEEVYRIYELPIGRDTDLTMALNFYDQASRLQLELAMERCGSEGSSFDLELQMTTARGRPIWVRSQGTPALEQGHVTRLVGALQDITDRKHSELALLDVNQKLAKLSLTDGLTGVGNRRLLDDTLATEWRRLARQKRQLALLMIDVDHFKNFNDAHGHLAGDVCLKRIAMVLIGCIGRPADLVARFGGEEFAVLLPETGLEGAQVVAEACLKAIAAEAIAAPKTKEGRSVITVSIGIGSATPSVDSMPASLIDIADAALYRAKNKGRACVSS